VKRLVRIEITDCRSCPWHTPPFDRGCNHPQNNTYPHVTRNIEGDDHVADFPSWCPLPNMSIHRPKTRGELRDKLREGTECEIPMDNALFTSNLLKGWLEFHDFSIELSPNEGWAIFKPTKKIDA